MPEKPPKVRKLTARQSEILEFIIQFIEENSYPPSIREIGDQFEIKSTNGVFDHINALVRKEYVSRNYFTARSITVLRDIHGKPYQNEVAKEIIKLFEMLEQYEVDDTVNRQIKKIRNIVEK